MTIAISESDYTQLWHKHRHQRTTDIDPQADTIDLCPPEFGRGFERWIELPGIDLLIIDRQFQTDLTIEYPANTHESYAEFGFNILGDRVQHPPSLVELAHQVGLNDRKLKQGFRAVFGTTVFGYLHEYRMTMAMESLVQGNTNVDLVIRSVGYASRSSFSRAFKQRFGASPRNYLV